jgi:hypothetical protein
MLWTHAQTLMVVLKYAEASEKVDSLCNIASAVRQPEREHADFQSVCRSGLRGSNRTQYLFCTT